MAYFKINNTDYSSIVSGLKVSRSANYNAQTNAAGDMVVDYINHKREIEVELIPLTSSQMSSLQAQIEDLSVTIAFRNPKTAVLETGVACIIPSNDVEYYTIQTNKVLFEAVKLKFIEL